jgi:hypothetical protein
VEERLKCSHLGSSSPAAVTEDAREKGVASGLREEVDGDCGVRATTWREEGEDSAGG